VSRATPAAGPLGRVVTRVGVRVNVNGDPIGAGANPLILINRSAFLDRDRLDKDALRSLLSWSAEHDLGQDPAVIETVARRRERAVAVLAAGGQRHRRLLVRPQWRLAVGIGNRLNPHEIGLSLHGTYGCPVIPGSTLKGLTRAWAVAAGADQDTAAVFTAVFGADGGGSVRFLDGVPTRPVTVARDVVTPHVQPYYRGRAGPGEHHNPIPSEFLVVTGGSFAVDLIGPAEHLDPVEEWCRAALDELGVGGKTAAGYGYLVAGPAGGS
jgi:CRISPR-associated protein Cmr6